MLVGMARTILHVDMDEFFAAVERLDFPELAGRCILVGGDPAGRGVVSTASYEARQFGCHSAMPTVTALRLCPQAVLRPVRGQRYREVSRAVFEIFRRFTPLIEPLSIDEAFLDMTGTERLSGTGEQAGGRIKRTIREELGLVASVGVGPNKFLAKLASDLEKPDGLTVIPPGREAEILDPLPISKLWGVGASTEKRLRGMGIRTIRELRLQDARTLRGVFGTRTEAVLRLAAGQDDRPVVPDSLAKSIGQEVTFPTDVSDLPALRSVLLGQAEQVARRLRGQGLQARTVTLKLRYGDFTTLSRSRSLPEPTCRTEAIFAAGAELLEAWARTSLGPMRLIGLTASNLSGSTGRQMGLFEEPADEKRKQVDEAVDRIVDRFGPGSIRRGG